MCQGFREQKNLSGSFRLWNIVDPEFRTMLIKRDSQNKNRNSTRAYQARTKNRPSQNMGSAGW
ncbi:MAG: hypothetical protein BGO01_04460 [Armatimonadetes bacterium 55-13]|nr:MAG: hypothetical protein BGO01_04460 [Armatimonadetes bacterium 55-13]